MERSRTIRRLRIAATVVCLTFCAAFVVLWVRSLTVHDTVYWPATSRDFYVHSLLGRLVIGSSLISNTKPLPFAVFSQSLEPIVRDSVYEGGLFGLKFATGRSAWTVFLPYWFLLPNTVGLAAAPWLRWRYSLRTLLIATTVTAVLLGVIAIAVRR